LAGATLGGADVAFSVTIVAVSFASTNYGARLIGNFMVDRKNQIAFGRFVATFVYCITVLLTLAAVGALVACIHHTPESINIMNFNENIGDAPHRSIVVMLDEADRQGRDEQDTVDGQAWRDEPKAGSAEIICAEAAGFLQQVDLESLVALARDKGAQVIVHRASGDFFVAGETIMSAHPAGNGNGTIAQRMRDCYTQGANRTDVQDVLFMCETLVRKSADGRTAPFPGQTHPTASVTGVPRAV
jgi:uncharacterized membrane protein